MSAKRIGSIKTRDLLAFLGEELEVRKSDRGAKYPLYLSAKIGPVHMNTRGAQDFILEYGVLDSVKPEFAEPEPREEVSPSPAINPIRDLPPKRGFFSADEDLI